MGAPFPAANLANLLSLPARHFVVVDPGRQRAHMLSATVSRGRPRLVRADVVDAPEEGFTTPEELREEIRRRLRSEAPEAVVLVLPQDQVLRHVLDIPPGDAAHTRAMVEREASSIGGLSESPWVFDAVRLHPFGGPNHPVAAAFCRRDHLQQLIEGFVDDERAIFDIRPAGDALSAAFGAAAPAVKNALLLDLGARHTSVTIVAGGQAVFASAFPTGSASFDEALGEDLGGTVEAAEAPKRTEPSPLARQASPRYQAAIVAWLAEVERTVGEWQADNPALAGVASWSAFLAGGDALQPDLASTLSTMGSRRFEAWPPLRELGPVQSELVVAWGALLLALGLAGPAPSLLPPERRAEWRVQRFWRATLSANLTLCAMLAMAIAAATAYQTRQLAERTAWKQQATEALQQAHEIRFLVDGFNSRMDAFRPVLDRQCQTVETLQLLDTLQRQRTNLNQWYVLLADAASYTAGSNNFPASPGSRTGESRYGSPGSVNVTNASTRAFIAEVCLVPEGEQMRQALSELVADLKRYPPLRNVDVLPAERRRELVASNLIFPERHFALELNLSEAELLPLVPVPKLGPVDREPRGTFRSGLRPDSGTVTNGNRTVRAR